ncbi:hypothetical protein [Candidatus Lucifugimonas marina]|uniref:Uncharacterized protein n=1 Tax=Candidatus Lucifugimonas marina TaxID=3038979 RepID=A0AAJ5ZEM2_9CHLR|nr:hypothetical protein [SAR202 cluster bacterium JH702]MDG0868993.1 hypothetical protein [SAR202 cluster bacterium JH639]WFG35618.1 hypothetical protein GKN94_07900 [SAR202 cluster bacterium JH545]WFG39565.1 hypothetical protein GKO48_08015 [SAR202 cluster bacterium JH1073]
MIKLIRMTAGLMLLFAVVISCSTESEPSLQSQPSATPEPEFERVTVTPVPIDTPTPAPVAKTQSQLTSERLADPVFPDWLDPDIATAQPSDEEIIQGWTEFLSNTEVSVSNWGPQHFCADGTHFFTNNETGELAESSDKWNLRGNPAIPSSNWGVIKIWDWLDFERTGGLIWHSGSGSEVFVTRSEKCLEHIAD